jgi:CBS domain-containing protein
MTIDDIATIGSKTTVGDLMTRGVVSIQATTTVAEAADLMLDCGFRHLIISDRNGFPDGIVSIRDLFRVLRRAADGETGP